MISYHPLHSKKAGELNWDESIEENYSLCRHQTTFWLIVDNAKGKILDAGCGLGRWVAFLHQRGCDISGIDASPATVARVSTLPITVGDVRHIEGRYDTIISLGVVEHFREGPMEALEEMWWSLRPNGKLLISIPTNNILRMLLTNHLKRLYWIGKLMKFEEHRYTRKEFKALLKKAKFKVLIEAPDDFIPPLNIGLWVDFPFLRAGYWRLNKVGMLLRNILWAISPWICPCGAFYVCEKEN